MQFYIIVNVVCKHLIQHKPAENSGHPSKERLPSRLRLLCLQFFFENLKSQVHDGGRKKKCNPCTCGARKPTYPLTTFVRFRNILALILLESSTAKHDQLSYLMCIFCWNDIGVKGFPLENEAERTEARSSVRHRSRWRRARFTVCGKWR